MYPLDNLNVPDSPKVLYTSSPAEDAADSNSCKNNYFKGLLLDLDGTLIDSNGNMHFPPQVAGRGCLCTEATGTDRTGYSTPAPMYGYFPKKLLDEGKVTLRIGDSGKWDIDLKDLEARSK